MSSLSKITSRPKRVELGFTDERIEASKIMLTYLLFSVGFEIQTNGICSATKQHISGDWQCGQLGPV